MSAGPAEAASSGHFAGWFGGYRSALSVPDLRRLLGGLVVSLTGTWAYNVALLAFVFDRTHSVGWVGAAGLVRFIPALVLSPYGGVIAERTERIRLLISSDLCCALWQAGAAAVVATGGPVIVVLALAALTSATAVVYSPAVAATIPSVVSEDDLVAANALNDTIDNLVVVAGPAIGAVLLLAGSPAVVFAVNAASFVISAAIVSRIRHRTQAVDVTDEGATGVLGQMAVGVRTIMALPAARTLVAFSALVSFVYGTDTILFVDVSAHRLGTGAHGFGYLLAGLGVGGILMAAGMDRVARQPRLALIILAGAAGYCLPTALLVVIHSPGLAFALQVIRGASTLIVDVLAITALQRAVPGELLGRVFGIFFAFTLGAMSLGALITPVVINALGLNGALFTMAFGPTALALLGLPALLAIDRLTAGQTSELAPRVALLEQLEIFAAASQATLERLAVGAVEVAFGSGRVIVREGEPADALYVLTEGEVEITARGEDGEAVRQIRRMTAPTYFGEIGVLRGIPRTATVSAVGDCRCDRISGQALLDALVSAAPSTSLMENARMRLALTHPTVTLEVPEHEAAANM